VDIVSTGMVVGEDLGQEGTERDQWGVDPVAGLADLLVDDTDEMLGGEDVIEEESRVENEGAKETVKLCGGPAVVSIGHGRPSLSNEGGEIPSIEDKAGLSCTSSSGEILYGRFSAILL
jgi:hypothetical protein